MYSKITKSKIISIILVALLIFSLNCSIFAESPHDSATTIMFFSDFQHKDGWKDPHETLAGLLDSLSDNDVTPDNVLICGDYSTFHGKNNHNGDPKPGIKLIKKEFTHQYGKEWDNSKMIFVQGNHDKKTSDISSPGLHSYDDYLVYIMNAETEYPSAQGSKKRKGTVQKGAKRLEKCLKKLANNKEKRPVFIASHVPIHFTGRTAKRGDNVYSRYLFDVLNDYGKKLDIVYLFGHNHDNGWDSYMGGSCVFRKPGDYLLIPKVKGKKTKTSKYTKETISFVYMNAGYCGYFAKSTSESVLNCSTCTIEDDKLVIRRYSESGPCKLSATGKANKNPSDKKLIPSKYYGKSKSGSFKLTRKN